MLRAEDLWLVEDTPADDPTDVLSFAEVRNHLARELNDDELGLRSLLECPEVLRPRTRRARPRPRAGKRQASATAARHERA